MKKIETYSCLIGVGGKKKRIGDTGGEKKEGKWFFFLETPTRSNTSLVDGIGGKRRFDATEKKLSGRPGKCQPTKETN